MVESAHESFLTELADDGEEVVREQIEPLVRDLSTLYEDQHAEEIPLTRRGPPSETGSEFDTDLEDGEEGKTEYDSSGIDFYLKICGDMKMRPVSTFMRQTRYPNMSLKYQSLGCRKTVAITQALTSNTFVEHLDLLDNDIGCEGLVSIASMLTENYFITELNLGNNKFGARGIAALCHVMSDHSYLKLLSLTGNRLNDDSAETISEMLRVNYTLSSLDLSHNQLSCAGGKAIAGALLSNDSLSDLDLSWNKIRSKGSECLGKMLSANTGLINFNLSHNGLAEQGAASFVKAIKSNSQTLNLNLMNTRFPGNQCKELGKALATNTTLKILKLGNNPIKEPDLEVLLSVMPSTALYILGLENIQMGQVLHEKLQGFEKEHGLVIDYGNSGGNKRARPMTASSLKLDEFITTNISKLAPLAVARYKDKTGVLSVAEFNDCLKEAGLRIRQNELNRIFDKLNLDSNGHVPCKEILSGKTPLVLEKLRNSSDR